MKRAMMGAAMSAMVLAAPLQAQCWSRDETAAATVRQLQSMLMVTALRCQAAGRPIMADYNRFVTMNHEAIARGNELLKLRFIRAEGPVAGQRGYDSFTTSAANGYGDGAGAPGACEDTAAVAREAGAMGGSVEGLLLIAERLGIVPRLSNEACMARPAAVVAVPVVPVAEVAPVVIASATPFYAVPPVPTFRPVLPVMAVESAPVVPIEVAAAAPAMAGRPVQVAAVVAAPAAPAPVAYAAVAAEPAEASAPDYVEHTSSRPVYAEATPAYAPPAYRQPYYRTPAYPPRPYPAPYYGQRAYPPDGYYAQRSYPPGYYPTQGYAPPRYPAPAPYYPRQDYGGE